MSVLIKIFGISLVGILMMGLLGCRQPNLYKNVYDAEWLRYEGKYRAAIAKYEAAAKKFPHFPEDTKIINVEFLTLFNYGIAFCYAKLAETEGDSALYVKAEAAVKESYQTAILPSNRVDPLYLWGYILFKQERYEEARTKFEALLETLQHNAPDGDFPEKALPDLGADGDDTVEALFGLGKVCVGLGDKAAARQAFAQLKERIETLKQRMSSRVYIAEVLYGLGKVYLELGDKAAAQSAFAQHLKYSLDSPYRLEIERLLDKQ